MIARVMPRAALLAAAGLLLASPIAANDSEAEIGLGGIVLKPSSALRLLEEDLYLAFPMPAQPRGLVARDVYYDNTENWSGFDFSTHVDGRPMRLQQIDRAMIGTRDVPDLIASRGWPAA